MPGKEYQHRQDNRRSRRVRHVVLAAVLALLTTVLVAGPASADGWPDHNSADAHHSHK